MRKHIILFLFLVTALYSCDQTQEITKDEVIDAINKFDSGWENKNLKAVDSVLSKKDNKVEILSEHCTPIQPKSIFH